MPGSDASSSTLESPTTEIGSDDIDSAPCSRTLPEQEIADYGSSTETIADILTPHENALAPSTPEKPIKAIPLSKFIQLKRQRLPRSFESVTVRPLLESQANFHTSWLQNTTCMARACKELLRHGANQCAACTARQHSSGGCRFQHLRTFNTSQDAEARGYTLTSDKTTSELVREKYKPHLSAQGSTRDAYFLLQSIKKPLTNILAREKQHEAKPGIIRRHREIETRNMCDGCATTIFSGHWICYVCARELCLDCFDEWDDSPAAADRYLHLNRCVNSARRMRRLHTKTQMLPSTRFGENELYTLQKDLAAVTSAVFETNGIDTAQDIPILKHSEGLPYAKADYEELSFEAFRKHWATGQPLLLTGFQHRFELDWTPEYFISNHGDESTELVDVISKKVQPSSVGVFFEGLKSGSAKAMRHLKLNDWPVVDDFALAMPELFEDFERALPYPLYTRRHGFLNLATWFPSQFLPPDLGPKLYCAGASSDAAGAKGTTVLHMDMTDAINIMAWAGEKPENRPGCAVWDVFTPADLDPIRSYLIEKLRKENPKAIMDDPIRRAQFYLNKTDLEHLAQRGILSKRIYQNPGDAVFIPAGCAHQVCNLTPCIKIACDFVCPENISRCSMITEADRKLAEHAKREDVLQLQNIIYFAYLGVREWVQNPVFRESLATTRAEYTKLPEDHDKSTEIASPARATQTEPSTVLRRGKRKRKAFAYDEYDSQTVEDISSSHNAAERCCHDGPHASRKQSSHETHDKLMTHSKLDRMNSHSTQPTIESRKTRRKRLSTPQDGDNSELGPSKRTSRPTEPSRMVKLRLHQGDMPELTKISTAESAYASFIETYGHAKLADLFYADDSYLKRDMQASNDDIEQNKPSTQYLAGSSGASLNNTPHPTTHEITGAPGAFRAMDDNAVASAEKSRDQSADVDQSSIEGVDQATTNEGMEVLSQLTGINQSNLSDTARMDEGSTVVVDEKLSKESTFNADKGGLTNDDSKNIINGSLETAPSNVTSS